MKGTEFLERSQGYSGSVGNIEDRNELVLPEVVIDDFGVNVPELMGPIFEMVWNAYGFTRPR